MPVPLIAAGISAIGGIVGAKIASGAAGKAADQQVASTQNAQGILDQAYAPYLALGAQGAGSLGNLVSAAGGQPVQPMAGTPPPVPAVAQGSGSRPRNGQPITGYAVPRQPEGSGTLASLSAPAQQAATAQTRSGYGGGGRVMMRAPDGSVQEVNPADVAFYESRGAQMVG